MRQIKCGVRCQYWNRPIKFEVEVEDDATDDDIDEAIRLAAVEEASFEYWRDDDGGEET